ncbi:MAG: cation transporting ATPase C-terminal domain-containing protein, partial [Duncaniella sp.]|nr:cation transporting ATPase C-terminal domain-containing protein [Duncaniella sp.]
AVMWGRSLYRNIQRFILFQLTVNVVASLIVLAGAFMGTQSPLTVTQMLWVNLIMDTFAAIALATLPPSADVMRDKPRARTSFIISRSMAWFITVVGGLFFVALFGLMWYFRHTDLDSLTQMWQVPVLSVDKGFSPYELSLFFTIFVFLQFWNLFNAKAFASGRSALHFHGCSEFVTIALFILIGQVAIVELGRQIFNVVPVSLTDLLIIIGGTSVVLWVGELFRLFGRKRKNV